MPNASQITFIECDFNNAVHLENLVELINEYIADDMGGGEPITGFKKLRLVDGLNNHPSKYIVFAVYNNEVLGLAVCFELFSTFTQRPTINIHDIIVKKDYRKDGVGSALIEQITFIANERNCSKITLEVREDNFPAQMLYIQKGFKPCTPNMLFWNKQL